jgi:uncharacterized Zn-binding protein involved in type VI secretion
MPGIARIGDILGPGGVLTAPFSPDVFVNGRPAALLGIVYTAHPCCGAKKCPPTHCGGPTFDGSYGVYINGILPVTKNGKGICGHGVKTASDNVIISAGTASQIGSFVLGKALG